MSGSVKSLAGGLVGAFIGGFFGMPGLGFSLGSALFAPRQHIDGPSAGDLTFDYSSYGNFQTWGYGTYRTKAKTFWSTNYVAHKHSSGGSKGGGQASSEYYTYTRSFAVHLRDCSTDGPIIGVRRIWDMLTGQLLYDVSDTALPTALVASKNLAKSITVYTGTSTQQPDPLIEASEGWAPAWPRRAYAVVDDADHGRSKQAKLWGWEIVHSAAEAYALPDTMASRPAYDGSWYSSTDDGLITFWTDVGGGGVHQVDVPGTIYTYAGDLVGTRTVTCVHPDVGGTSLFIQAPVRGLDLFFGQYYDSVSRNSYLALWDSGGNPISTQIARASGVPIGSQGEIFALCYTSVYFGGAIYMIPGAAQNELPILLKLDAPLGVPSANPVAVSEYTAASGSFDDVFVNSAGVWIFHYVPGTPHTYFLKLLTFDLVEVYSWSVDMPGWAGIFVDGTRAIIGTGVGRAWKVYELPDGGGVATLIGSGAAVGTGHTMHPVVVGDALLLVRNQFIAPKLLTSAASEPLTAVITDLCARAKPSVTDIDVSLLPATGVRMEMTSPKPATEWLQELGNIYHFRMRRSGTTLQCVPKGGAAVATIDQAEMGMDVIGATPKPPIITSRTQPRDLPSSVTIIYPSADNDYAVGQQSYQMRNFASGKPVTITTSAILTDADALALAQVACKEPHLERMSWSTNLGIDRIDIEPGDVVNLPTGLAWVSAIREEGDYILRCQFTAEASAAYTGNGLPAPTAPVQSRTPYLPGPTRLELLDVPALTAAHQGAGYLVAGCGYLAAWDAANAYTSSDGDSYTLLTAIDVAAAIGDTEGALPDATATIWDRSSTVTVRFTSGTPAAATETQLLNGVNLALIGNELCQFTTPVGLGSGRVTLGGTWLRGRFGTEWATGTHAAGERVVLIDSAALQRIGIDLSALGALRHYKGVSIGNEIANAAVVDFTPQGVSLKPWAPVWIKGARDGSGNLTISCKRRGRYLQRPFWSPALNEASLAMEFDVLNGVGSVVRTISASSETVTYTTAQMATDGITVNAPVHVQIYQISADAGRGYAGDATI